MGEVASVKVRPEFRELEKVPPPPPPWRRTLVSRVAAPAVLQYAPVGHEIVREQETAVGLVLWQTLRHVHDWVSAPEDARAALFRPQPPRAPDDRWEAARAEAPELASVLEVLASFGTPPRVGLDEVAKACTRVSEWAEMRGLRETALHFAEAAAQMEPEEPNWARLAGRLCREACEWHRSEIWYVRAIIQAREQRRIGSCIRAYLGYGTLFQVQGRNARAWRLYQKAGNYARLKGRRPLAALAWHDLLNFCAEAGEWEKALRYAQRALAVYPVHHVQLPAFAHDVGFFLVRYHYYTLALSLLVPVPKLILNPQTLMLVWSTVARAAAGAGQQEAFSEAQRQVMELASVHETSAAFPLVNLAHGAHSLKQWDEAARFVTMSLSLGSMYANPVAEQYASALLLEIAAQKPAPVDRELLPCPQDDELRWMVEDIVRLLTRWRGPTWRRKDQAGPDTLGGL
jgi:tetratricopeptide (TPR) repeat protein